MREHAAPTAFDSYQSRRYDDTFEAAGTDGVSLRMRLEDALAALGPGPGDVLDVGMGPGRLCEELARRGWSVSGIDASADMVALARARVPEAAHRFSVAPIETLPFGDGAFDAVVATGVLEYSHLDAALDEVARVLARGGVAVVSYPNPDAIFRIWKTDVYYPLVRAAKRLLRIRRHPGPHGLPLVPVPTLRTMLEARGLAVDPPVHTSWVVVLPPLDLLVPRLAERLARVAARRFPGLGRLLGTQLVFRATKRAEAG
ncbi:MAG TPA: class I SAM-dependent methyltransferase [Gaiellaceae bacterium]|nr:class I SAM-dependent methyltransferase [Gaiellaceae bacterium]